MTGGDSDNIVGGPARHIPVMLDEVLHYLEPAPGKLVVDGTFGAGGYTSAILAKHAKVVAIDRDPDAIRDGQSLVAQWPDQLHLVSGEFSNLDVLVRENGFDTADGVVLDIGVSSMQLDEADRGFSFRQDGPLDMRMAQSGVSAADVVNTVSQPDLTRIIGLLGEEKKASQISRAIVRRRGEVPFTTTGDLSSVIEKASPRKFSDKIHPATRTFQALRIFVNQELQQLAKALFAAERLLCEGGRLVVVTFHSLEDRIVKLFFGDRSGAVQGSRHMPEVVGRAPIFVHSGKAMVKANKQEAEINPRARSAKLRWGERTSAAAGPEDFGLFGFPDLVSLTSFADGEVSHT